MKKTGRILLLLFLALLLLCGCEKKQAEENEYTVYYVNATRTRLVESKYEPAAKTFEELMEELFDQLELPPSGDMSVLQDGVKVNGYERGIDALRIDFSKEYYELGNTDEVLLRAAIVKTFSQIPGVTKVMITVEQEQLHDAQGQPVAAMDADSFIDTKDGGINSYLYAKLALYFPDESGKKLVREVRSLHYSSNMVLERVIIEQLIAGPKEKGAKPVLTGAVKIQNLSIRDGICTISFDEEVNRVPAESAVTAEAALYAIVNSICETCDEITGVRIEIAGDDSVKFREEVDLEQVFSINYAFVEEGTFATEAQNPAAETQAAEVQTTAAAGQTEAGSSSPADAAQAGAEAGVDTGAAQAGAEAGVDAGAVQAGAEAGVDAGAGQAGAEAGVDAGDAQGGAEAGVDAGAAQAGADVAQTGA